MTALELCGRLGGATYGEVLQRLGAAQLPLPCAPVAGREETVARARAWMFADAKLPALQEAARVGFGDLEQGRYTDVTDDALDDFVAELGRRARVRPTGT